MSACGRALSAGAVAVAAASVAVLVFVAAPKPAAAGRRARHATVRSAAEVVVINDPTTKQPRFVATLDHATDKLILTPVSMKMPTQRDAELWIIPDGQKPISLGVIPQDARKRIAVPAGLKGRGDLHRDPGHHRRTARRLADRRPDRLDSRGGQVRESLGAATPSPSLSKWFMTCSQAPTFNAGACRGRRA
jgi:hypothetical protein